MKIGKLLALVAAAVAAGILLLWLYHQSRGGVDTLTRDATAPYGRFALAVRSFFSASGEWVQGRSELMRENEALAAEVANLQIRQLALEAVERENEELRQALDLGFSSPKYVCAEVVSRGGASGWWSIVRINKGAKAGLRRNCPVVNTAGLVGRIVAVSAETADVLLLTDANSKLACVIEGAGAGARGILSGAGISGTKDALALLHVVEPMSLAYLEKRLEVSKGGRVLTSGLGGLYPPGLPVGEVIDVSPDASTLFQRATVAPYVDFGSLNRVFVILAASSVGDGEGEARP